MGYNQGFQINTPDAASISAVRIVAPGADTHANDMDQREMSLSFAAGPGGITATSPSGPTVAPPGYYMLFAGEQPGRAVARHLGAHRRRLRRARRTSTRPPGSPTPAPGAGRAPRRARRSSAKPPATIASAAKAKSIALKVTRKGGKLIVSFALPKGTFNGNVRLYQVTTAAKKAVTSAKAKATPKPKAKLKLVAQRKVAKAKGRVTAPLVLPKQVGRTPMRFQVQLALTGTGGLRIVGLRSLTARGR